MSKRTIAQIFVGSLVAGAAGLIMIAVAGALAYTRDVFVLDGPDVVGVRSTAFAWWMLALAILGGLFLLGALLGQFVAWIGAVVSTAQLPDKTWFVVLLVTGLLALGFIPMIVYLVAGPGDPVPPARPALPPAVPRQQVAPHDRVR